MRTFAFTMWISFSFIACTSTSKDGPLGPNDILLKRFSTCAELSGVLSKVSSPPVEAGVDVAFNGSPAAQSSGSSSVRGETNLQVDGVDELDTAKADGSFIYLVDTSSGTPKLVVIRRNPGAASTVLQTLTETDRSYRGIFVLANQVIAISDTSSSSIGIVGPPSVGLLVSSASWAPTIIIDYFDRHSDGTLSKKGSRKIEGSLQDARMTGSELHLVTMKWIDSADALPATGWENNSPSPLTECRKVFHEAALTDDRVSYPYAKNLVCVLSQDTSSPDTKPEGECALTGYGSVVYASKENLYIGSQGWSSEAPIHQFALAQAGKSTRYVGSALVSGILLNSFAMDEFQGHLRVASTAYDETSMKYASEVSIFRLQDGNPEKTASVDGLGQGEHLYAVRFLGERGFVVTFKSIDPLYTLDLSNPYNPSIKGELKIPGYSTYLHPMQDGYLLAIGKDAEVAQSNPDFAWYQGLALSIFDVRDLANPTLIQKISIGSRGTNSEALSDAHAFRFDPTTQLLVLPIDLYLGGSGASDYGTFQYSGFHIYKATVDNGFEMKGVSQNSGNYLYGFGNRAFVNDGFISMVSGSGEFVSRSVEDPSIDLKRFSF